MSSGAQKTGGGSAGRKAKDAANAARMKAAGITRKVGACPICHATVSLSSMESHIISCRGRRKAVA